MIEKFYEFKRSISTGIYMDIVAMGFVLFLSASVLSLAIIYKTICGIIIAVFLAVTSLIITGLFVKDIVESIVDYKKAKLALISILDKTLEGGKYND